MLSLYQLNFAATSRIKETLKKLFFPTVKWEKGSIKTGSLLRMMSYAYISICVLLYKSLMTSGMTESKLRKVKLGAVRTMAI